MELEAANDNQIDMVSIYFITFNSKEIVMVAKLKTSSSQNCTMIPYKINTGSDVNLMPIHRFKFVFPRVTNEHLVTTKRKELF